MDQSIKHKCIVYVRVSDPSQVDGTSLDTQEEKCREYAAREGYEVVRVFREEGVSAKMWQRPEFTRALEFLNLQKGKVKFFVMYKIDRISRNLEDQYIILKSLRDAGADMRSASENIDDTPAGQLLRNMLWAFAEFDNKVRAERCLNGSIARFKEGYWTHTPPPGYLMVRDPITKRSLPTPDPERAKHIRWAFEQRALGASFEQIANGMNNRGYRSRNGRKINEGHVERIIKHPLYMGLMVSFGLEVEGKHKPLVSKELWHRAQAVNKERTRNAENRTLLNPLFPLRAFVYCSECDRNMTGSSHAGRSKKYDHYHHGTHCNCEVSRNVPKEELERKFTDQLASLVPNKKLLAIGKAIILDVWKERIEKDMRDQSTIHRSLTELKQEKANLLAEKRKNPLLYTDEEFLQQKHELDEQIYRLQSERREEEDVNKDFEDMVEMAFNLIRQPVKSWEGLDIAPKAKFQRVLFPEGLPFDGDKFGTAKLSLIIEIIQACSEPKSHVVDTAGIEPACEMRFYNLLRA